jgi:GntR family transcriptional regulator, N-acetylglucosamine utilization regulator
MWYISDIPLNSEAENLAHLIQVEQDYYQKQLFSIPLFVRIAEGLVSQIEAGELSPGDRLPAERELSENLGVNRMTLRRALGILEAEGLIIRQHGVGTYVAAPKIPRQMDTVFRFTAGMTNRGFAPGTQLISIEHLPVDNALARELQIQPNAPVFRIIRLRTINREPVLIETYTIAAKRFPGLDRHDLENRSIYEIFETEYGVSILRAHQSFEPIIASKFEAELLKIKIGAALMLEKRISYDQENQPIEYGKDRYRGDRFRFTAEAEPFDLHKRYHN